jgi:hypothetical protein
VIPVNDAIATAVTAMGLVAVIVAWACRGYWRARADEAYQDGHAAGIETQVARHARAAITARRADSGTLPAIMQAPGRQLAARPPSDVVVADITAAAPPQRCLNCGARGAAPCEPWCAYKPGGRPMPGAVIPFPEGLPPGLREYAAQVLADSRAMLPPGRPS